MGEAQNGEKMSESEVGGEKKGGGRERKGDGRAKLHQDSLQAGTILSLTQASPPRHSSLPLYLSPIPL